MKILFETLNIPAKLHYPQFTYRGYKPHVQHSCQWASQCLLYLVFITVTFSFRTL